MGNISAEQASAQILQRMSSELKRVAELAGKGQAVDLGGGKAAEGVNQGCNGICGSLIELGRASEVEVSRAATAAAIYHIRLYKELGAQGVNAAEGINQGCNGICGASNRFGDVSNPAAAG